MLPSMKFYVVSIVAIFTALGLGIYIGFSMDTEDFITDRQESLIEIVESNFDIITKENEDLILQNEELVIRENNFNDYVDRSYSYILPNKLEGKKISIIETNPDYIISGIGEDLEKAGAQVLNVTQINKKILNQDNSDKVVSDVLNGILKGEDNKLSNYINDDLVKCLGTYAEEPNLIIIGGGANKENIPSLEKIDRRIIDICKKENYPIIGVEKSKAKNSYIGKYKEYNISTIDNIDMKMGKVALVMLIEENISKGHYGIKGTAESVLPIY